jgi:hypothetical protein
MVVDNVPVSAVGYISGEIISGYAPYPKVAQPPIGGYVPKVTQPPIKPRSLNFGRKEKKERIRVFTVKFHTKLPLGFNIHSTGAGVHTVDCIKQGGQAFEKRLQFDDEILQIGNKELSPNLQHNDVVELFKKKKVKGESFTIKMMRTLPTNGAWHDARVAELEHYYRAKAPKKVVLHLMVV